MTGEQVSSDGLSVRALLAHAAGSLMALAMLPICLAIGVPFAGWAIGAGAVVANRLVHALVAYCVRDASLMVALGSMGFSMIFRAMLTAMMLFFVGAQIGAGGDAPIGLDRPDLARVATIIFLLGFTLDAGIEALRRAADKDHLDRMIPATPQETTA